MAFLACCALVVFSPHRVAGGALTKYRAVGQGEVPLEDLTALELGDDGALSADEAQRIDVDDPPVWRRRGGSDGCAEE